MTHTVQPANATIEEFMTMVAGGLAGASPHMISGTVTAISRLVYEFRGRGFEATSYQAMN
jgi:ribosomal RNA-processing protein 12